jgi:hypothetical protein
MRKIRLFTRALLGLALVAATTAAHAQFSVLYNFGSNRGDPTNPSYSGIVAQGRDGNLYSTAPQGGANKAPSNSLPRTGTPAPGLENRSGDGPARPETEPRSAPALRPEVPRPPSASERENAPRPEAAPSPMREAQPQNPPHPEREARPENPPRPNREPSPPNRRTPAGKESPPNGEEERPH